MDKKQSRRKMLRGKYKRYAAALAGAAIMTGAAMPATTFAAENPSNHNHGVKWEESKASASYDTRYNGSSHYGTGASGGSHYDSRYHNTNRNDVTRASDTSSDVTYAPRHGTSASYDTRSDSKGSYDTRYERNGRYDTRFSHRDGRYDTGYHNRNGWHRHDRSWPSSDDNRGLYKDGKIYYSSDSNRYDNYYNDYYGTYLTNPITFAKDYAARYGFNADRDTFALVSQSNSQASVQVTKSNSNQRFRMDLIRSPGQDWSIAAVRAV